MRKKRDKKEQKIDQKKHYDGLETKTDEKALADFRKPAYYSILGYLARQKAKRNKFDTWWGDRTWSRK